MYKQILAVKQADALHRGFSEPVARIVEPGHVKRAQVEMDSPLHEELREFIRTLKPKTESTYVLVNAMGAGEFYGDNINGDFFPYAELVRTSSKWRGIPVTEVEGRRKESDSIGSGYTTFYRANAFKHHINKDPAKSYGTVECAVWNDRMKRVELVVRLDHKWCEERGGMDVLERALRNDFQDVSMGCLFDPFARVTMSDGTLKPICEIEKGDRVLTHTGKESEVTEVFTQPHRGEVYSVFVLGVKERLPLTPEHPLLVLSREQTECIPPDSRHNNGNKQQVCAQSLRHRKKGCEGCTLPEKQYGAEWKRTDQIEVGDYLLTPMIQQDYTENKIPVHLAEIAGHYLAEGYLIKSNYEGVAFCLGIHEVEKAKRIKALLSELGGDWIYEYDVPERSGKYVTCRSEYLAQYLEEMCGEGAKTKKVSKEWFNWTLENQFTFLAAYVDGDGFVNSGSISVSTSSEQLSNQLILMFQQVGMLARCNKIHHKVLPRSVVRIPTVEYVVSVGKDYAGLLSDYARRVRGGISSKVNSKSFYVDLDGRRYVARPVQKIEKNLFDGVVYNFSVRDDESYLIENIASHNCKIPYDICSICGNKAKTPAEYCVHIRERRTNKDPRGDGQRPYMINIKPRFFDISFVFIGADKTARTLMKIASQDHDRIYDYILDDVMRAHPRLPVQEVVKIAQSLYDNGYSPCNDIPAEYLRYSPSRESSLWIPTIQPATEGEKTAGVFSLSVPKGIEKVSAINRTSARKRYEALKEAMYKRSALKMSDMIKYRLPNPDADEVSMLEKGQKLLPPRLLDEASDRYGLAGTLESAAREGIVLRRPEFTRVALRSSGLSSLVPILSSLMHPPTEDIDFPLPVNPCGCGLAGSLFTPFAPMRSIHPQHSITRIIVVKEASAVDDTRAGYGGRSGKQAVWLQPTPPEHLQMMSKISAAYNGYRCWLMANMEELEMGRSGEKQSAAKLFSGTTTDRELEETVMPLFLEYTYW